MWKIIVGFVLFAAIGMWVIIKGGDKVDMGGEKHGADAVHAPETAASAPLPGVLNAPAKAASDMAAAAAVAASATASAAK